MPPTSTFDPTAWALQTFGDARLGDARRPARAVQLGAAVLARPAASLPQQLVTLADLKAAYLLLHAKDVTHAGLLTPHWEQTRQAARAAPLVLLTSDTTILDYSHHPKTSGLGPIGNGRGRGYLVHSVLALCPQPRTVLGLAHQIPYVPTTHPAQETLREQQARVRQTDMWPQAVTAIGRPPPTARWVHVGDREADFFRFFHACRAQDADFLVRAAKNRRVAEETADEDGGSDPAIDYLFPHIRAWTAMATSSPTGART